MLVKDEGDVISHTLSWLLTQVDEVIVADNMSSDSTGPTLQAWQDAGHRVTVIQDAEIAYHQDEKTTRLAAMALERGYDWVVPCDADEFWRCHDPAERVGDLLDALPPEILFATADLYDHKATALDPPDLDVRVRQGWRMQKPGALPKVACRLQPGLRIGMGNHEATIAWPQVARVSSTGSPPSARALVVEHYPWRTEAQFLRKITNGARAYLASDMPPEYGAHWRAFGDPDEVTFMNGLSFADRVKAWFWEWGHSMDPAADPDIMFSPFPFLEGC